MSRFITLLFLLLVQLTAYGQADQKIIDKANALIAEKKYETAFKTLEKYDPKNRKVDIVLLKQHIALNFYITNIIHQQFAFKDLEAKDTLEVIRAKNNNYEMHRFPINEILDSLLRTNPSNCVLYQGLGDYYYEVYQKYGKGWIIGNDELLQHIESNYHAVIDKNCADYITYNVLGYICVSRAKYQESIPYLVKSIELNSKYPSSLYNLAYAYLYTDDRENALKYAKLAFDAYNDKAYKSDAARMIGAIYTELNKDTNALEYYELSNSIDPNNYYTLKALLRLHLKLKDSKVNEALNNFYKAAPDNPTIYNDLAKIYGSNHNPDELAVFYQSQIPLYTDNLKVLGNLNFYIGQLYHNIDKQISKAYMLKAKELFMQIYDKDHPVFKMIENSLHDF